MTANKRRKNKIAAEMESSGTNYLRAARNTTSALKDPVNLTWSPGVNQITGKKYADDFSRGLPHLSIVGGLSHSLVLQDVVFQLIQSNSSKDVQFRIIDSSYTHPTKSMKPYLSAFEGAPHISHYLVSDAHIEGGDTTSDDSPSQKILNMLEDLAVLQGQRANAFNNHPRTPKSLEQARAIAVQECAESGMPLEDHPLYLPYVFLTVHDLANISAFEFNGMGDSFQVRFYNIMNYFRRTGAAFGIYIISGSSRLQDVAAQHMTRMARYVFLNLSEKSSMQVAGDNSLTGMHLEEVVVRRWSQDSPGLRLTRTASRTPAEQEKMVRSSQ